MACRGACLVDPRYHAVLAVKVCALAGRALAAWGRLRTLTAALRRGAPVSGNPARHRPEFVMSLSSTSSVVAVDALLVRDVDGQYGVGGDLDNRPPSNGLNQGVNAEVSLTHFPVESPK
jgi:hypothetical protein